MDDDEEDEPDEPDDAEDVHSSSDDADPECGLTTIPSSENTLLTAGFDFCSWAKLVVSIKVLSSKDSLSTDRTPLVLYNNSRNLSSTFGLGNSVNSSNSCAYQFLTLMVSGISRSPNGAFSKSLTFTAKRMGNSSTMNWDAKKMDPGDGDGPN